MSDVKAWIEAIRPKTLPVSVAGVTAACACALAHGCFAWPQALLCLTFAVLAQVASNFANEYYDFRAGLDRPGREGPRRGVTEGDITPRAMLLATYLTLALASAVGLSLVYWGGWLLIPAGLLIAVGAIAYSAGPYPLSHHALGEVAVVTFFGIVPVCLTFWLMAGYITADVVYTSVAVGLAGANVLVVNNYRDRDDDLAVGKRTLAVVIGPAHTLELYSLNWGIAAILLFVADTGNLWIALVVALLGQAIRRYIQSHTGHALNPALGMTAMLTLATTIALVVNALL